MSDPSFFQPRAAVGDAVLFPFDGWQLLMAADALAGATPDAAVGAALPAVAPMTDVVMPLWKARHLLEGLLGGGHGIDGTVPLPLTPGMLWLPPHPRGIEAYRLAATGNGKAAGNASGPQTPGGSAPPGAPGGKSSPDEKDIVDRWIRELGFGRDPRVASLGPTERRTLARIASRNRGNALVLVENKTLQNLSLPGVKATDQLPLVLTLYDRLERAGVVNNGLYFSNSTSLASDRESELAGVIQEMAFIAVVAEHAAVNGYETKAAIRVDVPQRLLHDVEGMLPSDLPRISPQIRQRMSEWAEVDGYVVGDRIVEVKLRGRGKTFFTREEKDDDEGFVREQLQALKLLAVAKRDGLRGVEFALFGHDVDRRWLSMVDEAAKKLSVGIQVVLYPHGRGDETVLIDTMPEMERRDTPVFVELAPLTPPPEAKRKPSRREIEWGVEDFKYIDFMLHFVSEPAVRKKAEDSPRNFHKAVRHIHAQAILNGLRTAVAAHFEALGALEAEQERAKQRWLKSLADVGDQLRHQGDSIGVELARHLAAFAMGVAKLTGENEDIMYRGLEARGRFLQKAQVAITTTNATLSGYEGAIAQTNFLGASGLLSRFDSLREPMLLIRLRDLAKAEGMEDLSEISLEGIRALLRDWGGESRYGQQAGQVGGMFDAYTAKWRSLIDRVLPEAMGRWRTQMQEAGRTMPPAEPFPRQTAAEFLARFETMSSAGAEPPGKKRDLKMPPPGDWAEAVALLGLDGKGLSSPLGPQVQAAIQLLPDDIHLYPSEIDRVKLALDGLELFHVEGKEENVFFYLPNAYTTAFRMIRSVLATALLRHRAGTMLGLSRTLIFPWVIGGGQRGKQPFWLEVSPGGRADQLVLERIVVMGESQIPPRLVEELMEQGINLALPQEGGGTRMVHFDLASPIRGSLSADVARLPEDAELDEVAKTVIDAVFRDRHPEGLHIESVSRYQPVEDGYLTVPEIEKMRLEDAYLRHLLVADEEGAQHKERTFTAGRIRSWPEFVEKQLAMQRMAGRRYLPAPSHYFLRVRTSHRGPQRVLLHLDRIRKDFGEHLRLTRVPGFALATQISASGQKDVYGVEWTPSRVMHLFREIETVVPDAERGNYVRRFRSMAGGGRYSDLTPGQIALNLRELKRSAWGTYFRLKREPGQFLRQEMLDRGMSTRMTELIAQFIRRNVPEPYQGRYLTRIRGNHAKFEILFDLARLSEDYPDRIPGDLMAEVGRMLPARPVREPRLEDLQHRVQTLEGQWEALSRPSSEALQPKMQQLRASMAQAEAQPFAGLYPLRRIVVEFEVDLQQHRSHEGAVPLDLDAAADVAAEEERGIADASPEKGKKGGGGGTPSDGGAAPPAAGGAGSSGNMVPPAAAKASMGPTLQRGSPIGGIVVMGDDEGTVSAQGSGIALEGASAPVVPGASVFSGIVSPVVFPHAIMAAPLSPSAFAH